MPSRGVLNIFRRAIVLLGLGSALVAPAWAQLRSEPPLQDQDGGLMLSTEGFELWLPPPDWLDATQQASGNIRAQVDPVFRESEGEALLEIYPKGESEALWSTLYGVRISTGSGFTLKAYREAVMAGFSRNCRPDRTGFFQLGTDQGDVLAPLGYVCGAFDPRLRGYSKLGEVMVMSFRQEGDAVALIFQQWRGDAFDPADAGSWPVQTSVVEERARQLQAEPRLQRAD